MKRKKGKTPALSEERRAIVEELGLFKTDYLRLGDKDTWKDRIAEMAQFKGKMGHCNVPYNSGALGKWCSHVRNEYQK